MYLYIHHIATFWKKWKATYIELYPNGEFAFFDGKGGKMEDKLHIIEDDVSLRLGAPPDSIHLPHGANSNSIMILREEDGRESVFLLNSPEEAKYV